MEGQTKLLRIFIAESDKIKHHPLYEDIVNEARSAGLAGATAWRGILAFGPSTRIRTSKFLDLSSNLPVIIEIVDEESKIEAFIPKLNALFEEAKCGGLVTVEQAEVIRYLHGSKNKF
jgi:PII-like signaling protein